MESAAAAESAGVLQAWALERPSAFARVEVRDFGPSRGRGLVARGPLRSGEVVLRDRPLVAMQHDFSRRLSPACEGCLRMVGGLELHLRRLLSNGPHPLEAFPEALAACRASASRRLDAPALPCPTPGCGALFCSAACRDAELAGAHGLLCADVALDGARRRSWAAFRAHARAHHENLLLAARAVAWGVGRVRSGTEAAAVRAELLACQNAPWHELAEGRAAGRFSPLASRARRLEVLRESLALLRAVLPTAPELEPLLEPGFYARLLGEFDLVNVSVEYANGLGGRLRRALREPSDGLAPVARACAAALRETRRIAVCAHEAGEEAPEAEDAEELPPFMGVGLARLVALMNHSCEPSCEVDFGEDAVAVVTALRPVAAGEELTISYINEERPLAERQAALRADYRFACSCPRCCTEAAAALGRRRDAAARRLRGFRARSASVLLARWRALDMAARAARGVRQTNCGREADVQLRGALGV